jgi:hypothetical protein
MSLLFNYLNCFKKQKNISKIIKTTTIIETIITNEITGEITNTSSTCVITNTNGIIKIELNDLKSEKIDSKTTTNNESEIIETTEDKVIKIIETVEDKLAEAEIIVDLIENIVSDKV